MSWYLGIPQKILVCWHASNSRNSKSKIKLSRAFHEHKQISNLNFFCQRSVNSQLNWYEKWSNQMFCCCYPINALLPNLETTEHKRTKTNVFSKLNGFPITKRILIFKIKTATSETEHKKLSHKHEHRNIQFLLHL